MIIITIALASSDIIEQAMPFYMQVLNHIEVHRHGN